MKIIELRASSFARLSAVAIRPDGALVQITGRNGQGKTSCLNAIWVALKGRAVAPAKPIRKGAEQATLRLDLGAMTVLRTFKDDRNGGYTDKLQVTMADGARVHAKPQQMIDALLGDLSFDPLEFARMDAKRQFERVKVLVPGFDFEGNAVARQDAFDERTDANRKAKDARARASGVSVPPGPKPKVESTDALLRKLSDANSANADAYSIQQSREREAARIEEMLDEAEQLRARAATLEKDAVARKTVLDALPTPPAIIDTAPIADAIRGADAARRAREAHELRERHEAEADAAEKESAALTGRIEFLDREKREAVAKAKMPVKGLSFGDDEVLLEGLPFSQAALSEKIRASVGIGMALNPELRVMLVDEGSELDSESLALVARLAEEKDFQCWVCRVAEGDAAKAGFEIVDGALAQREAAE
jgi:DNA repair exonuclease SbcCD ATPase subunit